MIRAFLKPRRIVLVLIVAGVYFLAAKLGLSLAFLNASVSPVWPPTGVAIAVLLCFGYRTAPGVLLGALVANYVLTEVSLPVAAAISVGNTLEALTAVYLVRRFVGNRNPFNRAVDVLKFIVLASLLSTALSATIGNLVLCLAGHEAWGQFAWLWLTWWLGDAVGAMVVTPLIVSWMERPFERWHYGRFIEFALLMMTLALLCATIYTNLLLRTGASRPWGHITIPLLVWAAFRFGARGVATAITVLAAIAIWGTVNQFGSFAVYGQNESLLFLQAYIANLAITTLALAGIVTERKMAGRNLAGTLSITRILAESPAFADAVPRILQRICATFDWKLGAMWMLDQERRELACLKVWPPHAKGASAFEAKCYEIRFPAGVGLPGRVWQSLRPAWIPDVTEDNNFPRAPYAAAENLHAALGFPVFSGEEFLGVIEVFSHEIREPDASLLATFSAIGSQIGQFIQRKQTEEEIRFASLLPKENPSPVMRLDEGRIVSYANPSAGQILSRWDVELGKEAPASIVQVATAALVENKKRDLELPIDDRIYLVSFAPIAHAHYVNLYLTDITAQKRTEEALLQNQEWLRLTMEGGRMGTWTRELDDTNRVIWSPELEQIFGLHPGEFPQTEEAFFELIHPDDLEIVQRAVGQAIENHADYDVEFRYRRKDGVEGWMFGRGRAFYDQAGKPYRLAGLGLDITERKRAENESRQLAAIVESTDDAIIGKDLNGIITSWNSAAQKLYGYTAEEVMGQSVSILIPRDRPDEEPAILAKLRKGESIDHYETVRVAKDGRLIDVSLTVSPIRNAKGDIVGASKIARDITQKKQAEQERERLLISERAARNEAEVANRVKDEFLATLSHELRTPLTAMLGWLSMLRSGRLDEQTSEHALETIERNARSQAQLIEDLVDVSRITGGKLKLDIQPVDPMEVISLAADIVRPAANARGVQIEINAAPLAAHIAGDPARLQQIIWNLLSNAVKFTERDGRVTVSLRRVNSFAEIEISDTGIGIEPEFLAHVFERFSQAESPFTRSHRGLGLGLAIVRHLTELHGGTVTADSEGEGRGATFTIRMPLLVGVLQTSVGREIESAAVPSLGGLRVLLVEDEADARELISLTLRVSGASVQAVESVEQALDKLKSFKPDVLLSDIGLPVESGYDLIKRVRALRSDIRKIPAVALTAFATEKDRVRALKAGYQVHLAKPVEPQALVAAIENLVNGREPRRRG